MIQKLIKKTKKKSVPDLIFLDKAIDQLNISIKKVENREILREEEKERTIQNLKIVKELLLVHKVNKFIPFKLKPKRIARSPEDVVRMLLMIDFSCSKEKLDLKIFEIYDCENSKMDECFSVDDDINNNNIENFDSFGESKGETYAQKEAEEEYFEIELVNELERFDRGSSFSCSE